MNLGFQIIWEKIYINNNEELMEHHYEATYRARVIGGWLVRHVVAYRYDGNVNDDEGWKKREISMVFLPDPNHSWGNEMKDNS
jgi:hypothetical protein